MSTANSRNARRIPGTLVKDPTDLSAAYPYGGTELGQVVEEAFRYRYQHGVIEAEEWGNQVAEVLHTGTSCVYACKLRGFDNDAIAAMFTDTATVTPSRDKGIRFRTDNGRAGTLLSASTMKLLFVPEAVLRHEALLLWNAAPVIDPETTMALHMSNEATIAVMWYGLPDASNRVAEQRKIIDMESLL